MRFVLLLVAFSCLFGEEKISKHVVSLEGELLSYVASIGALPAKNGAGEVKGEISYISYVKEGEGRPLTFCFNGGPGSSSIWLHMGAFGPRRILSAEEGQSVIPPYTLKDNQETLLTTSDLVFVDPIGTGLSKANTEEDSAYFCSTNGDIASLALFIRDYLTEHKAWNRPLYLAGESYGALRCCGLAKELQQEYGIYLNGLILISCAIDYQTLLDHPNNLLPYVFHLPTYAATAWYHNRYAPNHTLQEVAEKTTQFAYDVYLPQLLRPSQKEKISLYQSLSEITSLPLTSIQRSMGHIDSNLFLSDFFPAEKKTLGMYDTRITGPYQHLGSFEEDPSVTTMDGIFSGAFHSYLADELDAPLSYTILSTKTHQQWVYLPPGCYGYPNTMSSLRSVLTVNPEMKVFVGMGYFDIVTPFAATEYCFEQLQMPPSSHPYIQKGYYEGGHMYYLNPSARTQFNQDLQQFYAK